MTENKVEVGSEIYQMHNIKERKMQNVNTYKK